MLLNLILIAVIGYLFRQNVMLSRIKKEGDLIYKLGATDYFINLGQRKFLYDREDINDTQRLIKNTLEYIWWFFGVVNYNASTHTQDFKVRLK
jgi:hypothetical protein